MRQAMQQHTRVWACAVEKALLRLSAHLVVSVEDLSPLLLPVLLMKLVLRLMKEPACEQAHIQALCTGEGCITTVLHEMLTSCSGLVQILLCFFRPKQLLQVTEHWTDDSPQMSVTFLT
jgi:hypothetical protein